MTARLEGVVRQPLRVILDRHLRTPPQARILHAPGEVLLLVAGEAEVPAGRLRDYRFGNVEIMRIAAHPDGLDLGRVMRELGRRAINDLMLEAGATLSGAMLRQGWVNEIVVYQSPDLLGSDAHGMFRLPGVTAMENKTRLRYVDVRDDWQGLPYDAGARVELSRRAGWHPVRTQERVASAWADASCRR